MNNTIQFSHHIGEILASCTDCLKDLSVMLDIELYFYQRVNYIELLVLIRFIPNHLYSLKTLHALSVAFITLRFECDSAARNKFTQADANKYENIKIHFQIYVIGAVIAQSV
jgi:hypothetical protein